MLYKNFVFDLTTETVVEIANWLSIRNMRLDTLQDEEFFKNNNLIPIRLNLTKYNECVESVTPVKNNNTWDFNIVTKELNFNELPEEYVSSRWSDVRFFRNKLLTDTDWTQLPDVPSTIKDPYSLYRQQLRDITQQTNPFEIVWPQKP